MNKPTHSGGLFTAGFAADFDVIFYVIGRDGATGLPARLIVSVLYPPTLLPEAADQGRLF